MSPVTGTARVLFSSQCFHFRPKPQLELWLHGFSCPAITVAMAGFIFGSARSACGF